MVADPTNHNDLISLKIGGAERNRTADLLIANEALYQLSYGPKFDLGEGGT